MNKTVCDENKCSGCHACFDICPKGAIMIADNIESMVAIIDSGKCIECGLCHDVCPNHTMVPQEEPLEWYQGWSYSEAERSKSSSGGFATELARVFILAGGVVCACLFQNGEFGFKVVDDERGLEQFRGSKYVKSNPRGIFKEVKRRLLDGQDVMFIGLPCQVAAVKNYVGSKLQEKLITVDLICHGTPSVKLFKQYLEQHGYDLSSAKRLMFRKNNDFNLWVNRDKVTAPRIQDRYTLSFLKSLTYTENCYSCRYATHLRVSDITIGDSWGSCLPEEEMEKGISLALCQTIKGMEWLRKANLHLENVDIIRAYESNHQLCRPSKAPVGRKVFFKRIKRGMKFDFAVMLEYPSICLKQDVKRMLLKMKLLRSK